MCVYIYIYMYIHTPAKNVLYDLSERFFLRGRCLSGHERSSYLLWFMLDAPQNCTHGGARTAFGMLRSASAPLA